MQGHFLRRCRHYAYCTSTRLHVRNRAIYLVAPYISKQQGSSLKYACTCEECATDARQPALLLTWCRSTWSSPVARQCRTFAPWAAALAARCRCDCARCDARGQVVAAGLTMTSSCRCHCRYSASKNMNRGEKWLWDSKLS